MSIPDCRNDPGIRRVRPSTGSTTDCRHVRNTIKAASQAILSSYPCCSLFRFSSVFVNFTARPVTFTCHAHCADQRYITDPVPIWPSLLSLHLRCWSHCRCGSHGTALPIRYTSNHRPEPEVSPRYVCCRSHHRSCSLPCMSSVGMFAARRSSSAVPSSNPIPLSNPSTAHRADILLCTIGLSLKGLTFSGLPRFASLMSETYIVNFVAIWKAA